MKWAVGFWMACAITLGTAWLAWEVRASAQARTPSVEQATDFGYPLANVADCDEYNAEFCQRDRWGEIAGQCTSWVAFRLQRIGFNNHYAGVNWGPAKHWAAAAKAVGIPVSDRPALGAVAWWSHKPLGHVAYVEAVSARGILISEMNADGHNRFQRVWIGPYSPRWPDGFIYLDLPPAAKATGANG
jgi:surface antigen